MSRTQFWRNLVCIFTHSTVPYLVPVSQSFGTMLKQVVPLCPKCDAELIAILERERENATERAGEKNHEPAALS